MKALLVVFALFAFPALADETCFSTLYDFRITQNYIEARGQNEHVRFAYHEVRGLTRRNRRDFSALIRVLENELETDVVLKADEAKKLERFSLIVADGREEMIGVMYAKGYDASGMLILRYMVTENGSYRCR